MMRTTVRTIRPAHAGCFGFWHRSSNLLRKRIHQSGSQGWTQSLASKGYSEPELRHSRDHARERRSHLPWPIPVEGVWHSSKPGPANRSYHRIDKRSPHRCIRPTRQCDELLPNLVDSRLTEEAYISRRHCLSKLSMNGNVHKCWYQRWRKVRARRQQARRGESTGVVRKGRCAGYSCRKNQWFPVFWEGDLPIHRRSEAHVNSKDEHIAAATVARAASVTH